MKNSSRSCADAGDCSADVSMSDVLEKVTCQNFPKNPDTEILRLNFQPTLAALKDQGILIVHALITVSTSSQSNFDVATRELSYVTRFGLS